MLIETLIDSLIPLNYSIYAFGTEYIKDCIVYNLVPIESNKITEQYRFELTIIALNYEKGFKMVKDIKNTLLTLGDEDRGEILKIEQNGGGMLFNEATKTYHFKLNFIIKSRYERGL